MKSTPRTAVVTGGGRGIGAAIAVALARTGVEVAVTARFRFLTAEEVAGVVTYLATDEAGAVNGQSLVVSN
jgi:NAD(P)-dependent dehydrogenase (short-subunit alcohol dehydrogenase family)